MERKTPQGSTSTAPRRTDRLRTKRMFIIAGVLIFAVIAGVGAVLTFAPTFAKKADTFAVPEIARSSGAKTALDRVVESANIAAAASAQGSKTAPASAVAETQKENSATNRPTARVNGEAVVVIDAGHQGSGDSTQEPIGPGASEMKARVTSGTSGKTTGVAEHVVNLQVAKKLKAALQAQGIKVVMVRESDNVNISNSERAKIGNDAGADLVIRLHCDGSDNTSLQGFLTLVPSSNQWTSAIVAPSKKAAETIHPYVLAETGAVDRGITAVGNMSGFNWSKVPTLIFEMGLMTNPNEDRALCDPAYQDKLVKGMTEGTVAYLNAR